MMVAVLFDEAGEVGAILHPAFKSGNDASKEEVVRGFIPQDGQHSAMLEVPSELQHLGIRELHDSVRVEVTGGSPRLVAKKERE
jgi:hypothetical protein